MTRPRNLFHDQRNQISSHVFGYFFYIVLVKIIFCLDKPKSLQSEVFLSWGNHRRSQHVLNLFLSSKNVLSMKQNPSWSLELCRGFFGAILREFWSFCLWYRSGWVGLSCFSCWDCDSKRKIFLEIDFLVL